MIKNNFIWYWNDGDETYTKKAYSLEDIIMEIISYYFYEQTKFVFIHLSNIDETGDKYETGPKFYIYFVENEITHEYHVGANPNDVAQFLADLAKECDREDTFEIEKI